MNKKEEIRSKVIQLAKEMNEYLDNFNKFMDGMVEKLEKYMEEARNAWFSEEEMEKLRWDFRTNVKLLYAKARDVEKQKVYENLKDLNFKNRMNVRWMNDKVRWTSDNDNNKDLSED